MMKAVILVLVLIAVQVFAGSYREVMQEREARQASKRSTCYIGTCAAQGASCNASALVGDGKNHVVYCTTANNYCDTNAIGGSYLCKAEVAVGQSCTSSSQCLDSYCSAGTCTAFKTLLANGQTCAANTDCQSENCVSSVCTGVAIGGSCKIDANCNIGGVAGENYCNGADVCAVPINLNAKCSYQTDTCADGLLCAQGSGTCVPIYSLASGAQCYTDNQCGDGLACLSASSTCGTVAASSGTACTADTDCSSTEHCQCNINTGSGVCTADDGPANPTGSGAIGSALSACYTGPCASTQTDSCALSKCTKGYCAYYTLQNTVIDATNNARVPACLRELLNPDYTLPSQCSKTSGAEAVVASVAVVALAVAALL